MSMVLAYRMRREPMLSAGARLSLGPATNKTFRGGSLPGWIELTRDLLDQAKDQGELLPHVETASAAWTLTAAWTGAQSVSETLTDREDFETASPTCTATSTRASPPRPYWHASTWHRTGEHAS